MPRPADAMGSSTGTTPPRSLFEACGRFEAAWLSGRPRTIEDEVAAAPDPLRARLFRDLLALEVRLVRRDGRTADLDAYLARFPSRDEEIRGVFADAPDSDACGLDCAVSSLGPAHLGPAAPGGFELVRELGRGGQAATYLARDLCLQRLVVLKRYHQAEGSGRAAVLNEGRSLARVKSPYVAHCYGVQERGDAIDLVVEYVAGRPLSELTPEDRVDPIRCAILVERVAEGLAEVHACGLLHRDIKPHNILLGDDGRPRLVDFGLAGPLASDALGAVAGSPPYMAPEQARGQAERIDARTDVYGLGGVLYFLLTGQPPHRGRSREEALSEARSAPVVPARRLDPRVPDGLARICQKALAADSSQRYPTADAFRVALCRYRRRRTLAPAAALGVASAVALSTLAWTSRPEGREPAAPVGPTPAAASAPVEAAPPRVVSLKVQHLPRKDATSYDREHVGYSRFLGEDPGQCAYEARLGDHVRIVAEMSGPGYAFLIAFRPDGRFEVCDPDDEALPPRSTRSLAYPPDSRAHEVVYGLEDGTGMQAFAVVASSAPLPPFRAWKRHLEAADSPWHAGLPADPGVVWNYDGRWLDARSEVGPGGVRGKGARLLGGRPVAEALGDWLRTLPGVEEVAVSTFSVTPTR